MKNPILTAVLAAALLACAAARAAQEETRYFYDDAGRLAAAAWSVGASNAAAHYRYDANGNRTGTLHVAANDLSVDSNGDGKCDDCGATVSQLLLSQLRQQRRVGELDLVALDRPVRMVIANVDLDRVAESAVDLASDLAVVFDNLRHL